MQKRPIQIRLLFTVPGFMRARLGHQALYRRTQILEASNSFGRCLICAERNTAQTVHQLIQRRALERKCPVSESEALDGGCRCLRRVNDLHERFMKASEPLAHQGK